MFWLFLLLLPWAASSKPVTVPGCPDVDVLEVETDITPESLNKLLLCFCKVHDKDKVAISCLYGSNLDHLQKATDAVKNASLTTDQISIQHMDFPLSGLPPFGELAPKLAGLEIRECTNFEPLTVSDSAIKGIESTLKNFTIHSCNLNEIPTAITKLENLETLTLSSNKLEQLTADIFANKKELNYLDLSGNFINTIEEDALKPLEKLETLVMGEHNYMNDTVLLEIGKLKNLKNLDLSRADGIYAPPMSLFVALPQLVVLKLSGCSISSIDPGVFSSLKHLEQLDLRVNLIENVSAYGFDGLSELRRLSLAGNYIKSLEKDVWVGLTKLEEIDLGWNEIKTLPDSAFEPMAETLNSLNLRHNPLIKLPKTGLKNLKTLSIGECGIKELSAENFKEYPMLENLDASRCNLSSLAPDTFSAQKDSLKVLNLEKNLLKTFDQKLLKDLPHLELLDVSNNPILCDSTIADFIFAIEDRYRESAKEGKDFLFANGNETTCDRPYFLRSEALLALDPTDLQPYNEAMDTTTVPSTTTRDPKEVEAEEKETTTPFKIPDLFIGAETNETLFKEEPRREVYDLAASDNAKGTVHDSSKDYLMPVTIGVIAVISLIAVVAVGLFMKKHRKIGSSDGGPGPTKKPSVVKIEDGMVEIELDSQNHNHIKK